MAVSIGGILFCTCTECPGSGTCTHPVCDKLCLEFSRPVSLLSRSHHQPAPCLPITSLHPVSLVNPRPAPMIVDTEENTPSGQQTCALPGPQPEQFFFFFFFFFFSYFLYEVSFLK